jgi:hypothetical protein
LCMSKGLLHAAGELIALPLRGPYVQRYLRTVLDPLRPQTLPPASNSSLINISAFPR